MTKRICMVAYTHYRSDARPRREATALTQRGDIVDFFSLGNASKLSQEIIDDVNIFNLPAKRYRGSSAIAYIRSYIRFFRQALTLITKHHFTKRYDVVHVHTMPDFMVFVAALIKPLGVKVILDVHDTMPELYQSKFGLRGQHPLIAALVMQERIACAFSDRVICVHEPHRDLLMRRGVDGNKITPILNVPDSKIFGPPRDNPVLSFEPPRIFYHGTIAQRLGLDVALHAFRRVHDCIPTVSFNILGTGDQAEALHSLIADLGLNDAVNFADKQFAVEELPKLLADATIGLVPNRSDPATQMMLPVKLLEYVHLGIPAIAPRLPVIKHYFSEDALAFYEPGNCESMATAIINTIKDQESTNMRRLQASTFARQYQWDNLKHDLYSVIDS
ncbi:MAG: glycosyltransferase family 4 protein [Deltaproteobacteria bacterium]|nr:glycosyltransferase family 4 protein [Deltaproteobacteria bacterium]